MDFSRFVPIAAAAVLLSLGPIRAEESLTATTAKSSAAAEQTVDAQAMMRAAHDARAVWNDFPGFHADITVTTNGVAHQGTILVTDDLDYELSISDDAIHPWVNSKLSSVIGHRRPSGEVADVTLSDRRAPSANAAYVSRTDGNGTLLIEEGYIREVHRKNDSRWFEITNVDLFDAGDGKVLPAITSVTYRDPKTGNITKQKTNRFEWTKVGQFFLPEHCFTVETSAEGGRQTRQLTFTNHRLNDHQTASTEPSSTSKLHRPLPESLTSFGAAALDGYLYVFSGHSGDAHGFGRDLLVDHFRRIKFDDPNAQWEELAMHEPAQSTALVSDGKYLYRIGGLTFLNGGGEEETVFQSTDHFTRYDIENDHWTELEPLPVPRSSLDAAVVGRTIYAVGGWDLQGEDGARDAPWHDTMHAFDLDKPEAGWQTLDGPGYELRAISAAAHDGKLYAIGGISPSGFLRKTSVYDPASGRWSEGPELVGDHTMTGFATSTFAVGGHLYSTGASGIVYRLSEDGGEWQVADRLLFPRMFLRLLPAGPDRLIALGGTGGFTGRTSVVETLKVDPETPAGEKVVSWTVPYEGDAKHSQTLILDGTKLYAFGGNNSWQPHDFSKDAFENEAFRFDIANRKVERLPEMPVAVQSGAGAVNQQTSEHKTLVIAGGMNFGESGFGAIADVLEFDPEAEQWTEVEAELPAPRAMAEAVSHDDAIWIFGGSGAGQSKGLSSSTLHWWGDQTAIAPLPEIDLPNPRRSFGGAVIDGEYFMVGGLGSGMSIEATVDVFNLQTRTWRTAASPAAPRVFPRVVAVGKKLYLFGGFSSVDGHFSECKSLEVYDSETDTWQTVADSIDGVDASMRLFNLSGRLLFFGIDRENEGLAKFVMYDPNPTAEPEQVAAMSFGRRRGNEAERNAKMLMRKDADKDGTLDADELGERMAEFLNEADKDGDGRVSFLEAKAKMEADEQAEKEQAEKEQAEKEQAEKEQAEKEQDAS